MMAPTNFQSMDYLQYVKLLEHSQKLTEDFTICLFVWTFLHSDHELPPDGNIGTRRNGVGILLDNRATAVW